LLDLLKGFSERAVELFRLFLDPKQAALRRVFFWVAATLVVFFLFWGVNALNSQREDAMRARYKIPGESAPVKTAVPVEVVVPAKVVTERPVVITPAPVRPKKVRASETTVAATEAPASIAYVIQVVTYPTRQDADQIVATFKRAGLRAFVKENTRPSGRLFYQVLLGGFRTEAEAQSQLLKFRAQEVARPFQDAFVKSSRT
jgi:cell division septation protein DedD